MCNTPAYKENKMLSTLIVLAATWAVETQNTLVTSAYNGPPNCTFYYRVGNTLEVHPRRFLIVKNVNKWNPPELAPCVKTQIALQWNSERQLKISSSYSSTPTWT